MSRRITDLPEGFDPELLEVLSELRGVRRDPSRVAAGRAGVMVAAARARSSASVPPMSRLLRWRRRGVVAALGLAGANLAVGGVVALAAGAQPDSVLYGVKRAAETAKLSLTFDPQDKARLQLDLADRRAGEAATMAHNGHADLALDAARDATTLVRQAAAALGDHPSAENAQALDHASTEALSRLQEVFAALENGDDPGAAEAARSLDDAWSNGLGHGVQGDGAETTPQPSHGAGPADGTGASGPAGGSSSPAGAPPTQPAASGGEHGGGGDHGHPPGR
jgi:hypothetical protein